MVNNRQIVSSGSAYTPQDSTVDIDVVVDPASLLAALTITFPANPKDQQDVNIFFGGTIAGNSAVVTTFAVAANTGQTLVQQAAPTSGTSGQVLKYKYRVSGANKYWYRVF